MSDKKENIIQEYPVPVYNYRVAIDEEYYSFSEVSGLSMDLEPVTYKHGLSYLEGAEQIPGMRGEVKLTLKRGILRKRSFFLDWITPSFRGSADKRTLTIHLCDEEGTPLISWKVFNAFPIKMDAPSFTADSNDVAIESLELIANYLEIKYHN